MSVSPKTKEPQYSVVFDVREKHGIAHLGLMANKSWNQDPRRTLFTLARYKFVAKMLAGRNHVLEVGCADAFGTRIVQQVVGKVSATDFDPVFIADVKERMDPNWLSRRSCTICLRGRWRAHLMPHTRWTFWSTSPRRTKTGSSAISLYHSPQPVLRSSACLRIESQSHASPQSKAGHVNCKSGEALKRTLERHFHTVFVFSMNDEVVHTGFYPMAHYLIGVACHRRDAGTDRRP